MKIFVNKENSGWILDNIYDDYKKFTRHNIVGINDNPDICWLLNFWELKQLSDKISAPIVISFHHVSENKIKKYDFDFYNKRAKACLAPNKKTEEFLKKYLTIPIYRMPYWILSKMMMPFDNESVGKRQEISRDEILIGSFQKDGEGDTSKPKLEKGPDIFVDIVTQLIKNHKIKVVLSGYNRKYMVENLQKNNIPFVFYKMINDKNLNLLYDCLDWYFITSRFEGGPQSVLEASFHKIKILSTDVGMAPEVLHSDCICKNVEEFIEKFSKNIDKREENYKNVQEFLPFTIIPKLDFLLECLTDQVGIAENIK